MNTCFDSTRRASVSAAVPLTLALLGMGACSLDPGTETPTLPPTQDVVYNFEAGSTDITLPDITIPETVSTPDATTTPDGVSPPDSTATPDTPQGETATGDTVTTAWAAPTCGSITGTPAITFTADEGATLAPVEQTFNADASLNSIVASDVSGRLLATLNGELLVSADAGCVWSSAGTLGSQSVYRLVAGIQGAAWAFTPTSTEVHHIDGSNTTTSNPTSFAQITTIRPDTTNAARAFLMNQEGVTYQTVDTGASWISIGQKPTTALGSTFALSGAFDPVDATKALVGFDRDGIYWTEDLGDTWTKSTGLGLSDASFVEAHEIAYSPADPDIVWAVSVDTSGTAGLGLFRSANGGRAFVQVAADSSTLTLGTDSPLAPVPGDEDTVFVGYSTLVGEYGIDLHRYNQGTGLVTTQKNDNQGLGALLVHPAGGVVYLGFTFTNQPI